MESSPKRLVKYIDSDQVMKMIGKNNQIVN